VEAQIPIALQRGILFANPVDAGDKFLQAPGGIEIAMLEFVLLRIQILFASRLVGSVFA